MPNSVFFLFSPAGVMLAHLHELQSENRRMQSRIMELASQREFYIATNTRLRQTLSENEVSRLPNGVQPLSDSVQQTLQSNPISLPDGHGRGKGSIEGPDVRHQLSSLATALPKAAQDSLLQAHFLTPSPTMTTTLPYHSSVQPLDSRDPHLGNSTMLPYHRNPIPPFTPQDRLSSVSRPENPEISGGIAHDVTQVTNSIQAPITAHTPLPMSGTGSNTTTSPTRLHSKTSSHHGGSGARNLRESR